MNGVKIEHWWIGLVVSGVAVTGAAKLTPDPQAIVAVGLGLICIGIGEWISRPRSDGFIQRGFQQFHITGNPRRFSLLGFIFTLPGIVLFGAGLVRVAIALFK